MRMFWDNDIVLMPGGEQSFCNDFCVDLCVTGSDDFKCEITNCLNKCNLHFGSSEMVQPTDNVVSDEANVSAPPPHRDHNHHHHEHEHGHRHQGPPPPPKGEDRPPR